MRHCPDPLGRKQHRNTRCARHLSTTFCTCRACTNSASPWVPICCNYQLIGKLCCWLRVACCVMRGAWCVLCVAWCELRVACCGACCVSVLCIACCVMSAARCASCLLHVACCMLCIAGCCFGCSTCGMLLCIVRVGCCRYKTGRNGERMALVDGTWRAATYWEGLVHAATATNDIEKASCLHRFLRTAFAERLQGVRVTSARGLRHVCTELASHIFTKFHITSLAQTQTQTNLHV
jgi:hypothetical protein